ncbi:hypothetical protein [Natrinema sp. SYSU A 869]|uniref:hypothetical protein n=1 Tax=Natrinema sp. SYSU A 869 TaxID=2871694 RepID=UPI001CA3BE58|nr:hypothetical protein [Natrinema sp. SYSU A 869]
MKITWLPTRPEGYARHAIVAILGVVLFIPGYIVQTLLLGLLSGAITNIVEPYSLLVVAIGPALCIASIVGWVVNKWYGKSAAVGVAAVLVTVYSLVFYAIELVLTI